MKIAFFLTYFSLLFLSAFCQSNQSEAISSSGNYFEQNGISLSWTLGETITETFPNNNIILTQGFQQTICSQTNIREYLFSQGYQFVSTQLVPENPDMLDVLENILNENLDFVRNSSGNMLRKIGPVWVNGIGNWITTEGYLFKMNDADILIISGQTIDPQTPINLLTGYQIISFLPDSQQNTSDVFENILENLDFVRNTSGNMFRKIGPVWVNGIGNMQPGQGYLVKMNASDILIYPNAVKKLLATQKLKPEHFQSLDGNPYNPVWSIYFEKGNMERGDEIAIFDNKKLVGAASVNSKNVFENEIPVFGNLFKVGNKPIIKIWDKSENKELCVNEYIFTNTIEGAYTQRIFPAKDGEFSLMKFSINEIPNENPEPQTFTIYPNPTKGKITIGNLIPSGQVCNIRITDITSNIVFKSSFINSQPSVEVNLSQLEKGVYFISLIENNCTQVKKIIIR